MSISTPRILNILPSPKQEDDWRLKHALQAGLAGGVQGQVPASVDLREAWWNVGDQGSTGSCVGWATADSVLRWHMVKAERLAPDQPLSPRFTWMAAKETDEFDQRPTTFIESDGTSLKAALDVARKYGAVKDAILPFDGGSLFQGEAESFYAIASRLKIASYHNLSLSFGQTVDDWRFWLARVGPILVRLDVDRTWAEAKANDGRLDAYQPDTILGGHAVALVGYTADRFLVRNSWGTTEWGDATGHGHASIAYAKAAFTEAYGVRLV